MMQQSTCKHCFGTFTYNDNDRGGKFCSRTCHYQSKNVFVVCKQCGKDFRKRLKDPRKTCSLSCYQIRRAIKSRNETIREEAHNKISTDAGQISIVQKAAAPECKACENNKPLSLWERLLAMFGIK